MPHAKAAILSMGDELTLGQRLDTNSQWLSARLLELGIEPVEHATIPDDLDATVASIKRLASTTDLIISTGGLGPTADDLCRHAVALATSDTLIEDANALEDLKRLFSQRSRPMPDINRIQAHRPSRTTLLPNPHGTAPGLHARLGACDLFCLPGPPREMMPMFEAHVLPRLTPVPGRIVRTHALHCFGIGESDLATRLGPLMDRSSNPLVGTTATGGIVSIRLRYDAIVAPSAADHAMQEALAAARAAAGPYCFGEADTTLQQSLLAELRARAATLSIVESCTGGMLGELLTQVPGSSSTFLGGWITYSNELKSSLVGVPQQLIAEHGAVSRQTAQAMAAGGLERSGSTYCLSITGIAGPDGGTPDKPVGTVWIALAHRTTAAASTIDARRFNMQGGDRHSIREWSARAAMMMLYLHLKGSQTTTLLRQREQFAP